MASVKNQLSSMKKSLNDKASSAKDFVKEKASSALNSVKSMLGKEEKADEGEKEEIDLVKEGKQVLTDFSKSAINGAIEKIKIELEQNLKDALSKKKSDFEKIILDKIGTRMNASSIGNYLKQMNPSYTLSDSTIVGGSGTKHVKRKRKTKKKPKHIHNKTKKRQQGGNSDFLKQIINSSLQKPNLTKVLQSAITNVMISFPEYPQNQTKIEDAMEKAMKRIFDKISSEDIKKAILSEKCVKHIQ